MHTRLLLSLCAAGAAACATRGAPPAAGVAAPAPAIADSSGRQVIAGARLTTTTASNVFDALNALDQDLLNGRGRGAPDVYVDGVKQAGGLTRLRDLMVTVVRDVTYLRFDRAQKDLPDSRSPGGAILVRLQ
jgi:hypothetical protein